MNSPEQDVPPGRFGNEGAANPADMGRRNVDELLERIIVPKEPIEAGAWSHEEADRAKEFTWGSRSNW